MQDSNYKGSWLVKRLLYIDLDSAEVIVLYITMQLSKQVLLDGQGSGELLCLI